MLPEALSTNLTSLNEDQDRMSVVIEMVFEADGSLAASDLYRARVRNHGKLAYRSVAAGLDGNGPAPHRVLETPGLDENLRLQDSVAQRLLDLRHRHGALSLATIEAKAVFEGDVLSDLALDAKNRAQQLIEDFMIAANGVTATYLESKRFPSLRRVLRSPERWDRIAQLASGFGDRIPNEPDPRPFVALQRDAITLVAPSLEDGVEARPDPGYTALREVACLLPTGILRGSLAVLLNMREWDSTAHG
jgi:exoribonuclease-2